MCVNVFCKHHAHITLHPKRFSEVLAVGITNGPAHVAAFNFFTLDKMMMRIINNPVVWPTLAVDALFRGARRFLAETEA